MKDMAHHCNTALPYNFSLCINPFITPRIVFTSYFSTFSTKVKANSFSEKKRGENLFRCGTREINELLKSECVFVPFDALSFGESLLA